MTKKVSFGGRILMVGYGSVGQCTLPLLLKHIDMPAENIAIVDGEPHEDAIAPYRAQGVRYEVRPIVPENLAAVLSTYLSPGGMLLNLSVEVDSLALINWCQENSCTYLDTCIEPWANYYDNPSIPADQRTNYYLRYRAKQNAKAWGPDAPSALLTHGANPGLISHFVKAALCEVARDQGQGDDDPSSREDWAALAQTIGLKVIHVAEHDTQISSRPKRMGEFVNTWSVPGFIGEGLQPAELGWGTHEKHLPAGAGTHKVGPACAIFLDRPGCVTEVRSWTPLGGPMRGFCITHGESITLSDYLTVWDGNRAIYRPTVHYAYHPCNDAVLSVRELAMRNFHIQPKARLLGDDIVEGIDELGALLMGSKNGNHWAIWYGSQLSIGEARQLMGSRFNATSIQIAAPVLAGALWMIENPRQGLIEPEDLDHQFVLDVCRPYLGPVVAVRSDWTPLLDRGRIFAEPGLDMSDPWQFQNFLIR